MSLSRFATASLRRGLLHKRSVAPLQTCQKRSALVNPVNFTFKVKSLSGDEVSAFKGILPTLISDLTFDGHHKEMPGVSECLQQVNGLKINYSHDDISIALYRDTMLHVEIQLKIYGAKNPFMWNHLRFFHLLWPMLAQQ